MKKLSLKGKIILGVIGGAILLLIIIIILNLIPKKNVSDTPMIIKIKITMLPSQKNLS